MTMDRVDSAHQLAGLGAERARCIVSLYCRVTLPDAHSLVVDAVLFMFDEEGATVQELVNALGLTAKTVQTCLDRVPRAVIHRRVGGGGLEDETDAAEEDSGEASGSPVTAKVVVDYASALPFIYAHWRRSLALSLSEHVRYDELRNRPRLSRLASQAAGKDFSLVQVICCRACELHFLPKEIADIASCRECASDLVTSGIQEAQTVLAENNCPPPEVRARSPFLRDRRLLRQALAMEHLYSSPFVLVDKGIVSDHQSVLVSEEFKVRSRDKTATSLLFRYRKNMRIQIISSEKLAEDRIAENSRRIAARAMYPPWFEVTRLPAGEEESSVQEVAAPLRKKSRREIASAAGETIRAAKKAVELHFAEFVDIPLSNGSAAIPR